MEAYIDKACEFFDRIHEQSVVMACHDCQKCIKIDLMRLYICLSCDFPSRHACKINNIRFPQSICNASLFWI